MQIGEVAARTELSLRSLRHWEEVGLLQPSGRTDGGFRLYTEADVDKILVIRRMKPLGIHPGRDEGRDGRHRDPRATRRSTLTAEDAARQRLHAT